MPMPSVSELSKKELTNDHLRLLEHCKSLVQMSRDHMGRKYDDWDHYDEIYRGIRQQDDQDKKTKKKQEPVKMVVPVGFAQLQTFVSFCYQVFTQREYFFELIGSAPEDFKAAKVGEALLQRDLEYNKLSVLLWQFLTDVARFGLGVMKCHWVEDIQTIDQTIPPKTLNFLGLQVQWRTARQQKVDAIKYQGNKLTCISPYNFFPDPRLPLGRFQEGEFVASEDGYSYTELRQWQKEGKCFGIEFVEPFKTPEQRRRLNRLGFIDTANSKEQILGSASSKPPICITEVQVKLIPSEFKLDDEPIGQETYPVKYLIWYANDQRIVRCEPLNYLHDEFTYVLSELTPDQNHFLNAGLLETIDELQDVISWFINSHITSVRRTIENRLVVDPMGVEMEDLYSKRPVLRLKPDAGRSGVERWIKQLDVHDVTGKHIDDANQLHSMVQMVTGINENLLGQFHGGRRSATEARNVTTSAASRVKTFASIIWASAFDRLGRQMLSNLRDGLTVDTYVKMFGDASDPMEYQVFKKITREDIVGNYDFTVFDGTIPSEKGYMAEVLSEFLLAILQNPQAIMFVGLDPKLLAYEVLRMKGVKYPERFGIANNPANVNPAMMGQLQQLLGGLNGNGAVASNGKPGQARSVTPAQTGSGNDILAGLLGGNGSTGM